MHSTILSLGVLAPVLFVAQGATVCNNVVWDGLGEPSPPDAKTFQLLYSVDLQKSQPDWVDVKLVLGTPSNPLGRHVVQVVDAFDTVCAEVAIFLLTFPSPMVAVRGIVGPASERMKTEDNLNAGVRIDFDWDAGNHAVTVTREGDGSVLATSAGTPQLGACAADGAAYLKFGYQELMPWTVVPVFQSAQAGCNVPPPP